MLSEEIIKENIRILNEKWSKSDKVEEIGNEIIGEIKNRYIKEPYRQLERHIYTRKGKFKWSVLDYSVDINFIIYEFTDENVFAKKINDIDIVNYFDEKNMSLTITCVSLYNEFLPEIFDSNVIHEVEHLYQFILNKNNNSEFKTLTNNGYKVATKVIESNNATEEELIIANLIYYSNPREQDAFIQEYYRESLVDFNAYLMNETTVDERFNTYKECFEKYKQNINSPSINQALLMYRQYGYTQRNFIYIVTKAFTRFERKFKNIRKAIRSTKMKPITEELKRKIFNKIIEKYCINIKNNK